MYNPILAPGFRLKGILSVLCFPLLLSIGQPPSALAQLQPSRFAGDWSGAVVLPTGEKPFHVKLEQSGASWSGTLESPPEGVRVPLEAVRINGDSITFSPSGLPIGMTFSGELQARRIDGVLFRDGQGFPFWLEQDPPASPHRPQTPQPPFPYRVEEVTYRNGEITLAATLTIPQGQGPFPAAVMITGSGAQDRDETIFDHRPFAVIADHLTRGGIAVLRADDRGVGGSSGSRQNSTTEDFALDALAGLRFLQARPEIDADKIGLIGHSEGGIAAPIASAREPAVSFIVMLAGTGVPLKEVLVTQARLLYQAAGADEDWLDRQEEAHRKLVEMLAEGEDGPPLEDQLRALMEVQFERASPDQPVSEDITMHLVQQSLRAFTSPWFRFALTFDPREALRQVRVPVLVLNGTLDLQVCPEENLPEIGKALQEAGNPDVTIHRLEGLNHLFQRAVTGTVEEYAEIEETIAPHVLDLVLDWLLARFGTDQVRDLIPRSPAPHSSRDETASFLLPDSSPGPRVVPSRIAW